MSHLHMCTQFKNSDSLTEMSCYSHSLHVNILHAFLLHMLTGTVLSFFVQHKYGISGRIMISRILINKYNFLANVGDVVLIAYIFCNINTLFFLNIEQLHCCCSFSVQLLCKPQIILPTFKSIHHSLLVDIGYLCIWHDENRDRLTDLKNEFAYLSLYLFGYRVKIKE